MVHIEQIPNLSEAELDLLPQGIIRLDKAGKILYYNPSNAELGHLTPKGSIGRNFFRDVAPCTAVKEFQGRFDDFVGSAESRIEPFNFNLRFAWGSKLVSITMVKTSGPAASIYIVIST